MSPVSGSRLDARKPQHQVMQFWPTPPGDRRPRERGADSVNERASRPPVPCQVQVRQRLGKCGTLKPFHGVNGMLESFSQKVERVPDAQDVVRRCLVRKVTLGGSDGGLTQFCDKTRVTVLQTSSVPRPWSRSARAE